MVIRNIQNDIPDIDSLGLPEILKKIMMVKNGLILVVGGGDSAVDLSPDTCQKVDHYPDVAGKIMGQFLNVSKVAITLRESLSASRIKRLSQMKNMSHFSSPL